MSILRSKNDQRLEWWNPHNVMAEWTQRAPILPRVLRAICGKDTPTVSKLSQIVSTGSMLLFTRNNEMGLHQYVNDCILRAGGADSSTYARLHKQGVCHPRSSGLEKILGGGGTEQADAFVEDQNQKLLSPEDHGPRTCTRHP